MRNTLIAMSCLVMVGVGACAASAPRRVTTTTGTAGTTGTPGTAGTTTGAGGDTSGTAGTTAGTGGDMSGTAGTTAGTGGMDAGMDAPATTGTAGAGGDMGTAGAGGAGGDMGTAGAGGTVAAAVCNNSAVVTAGGSEANCGAKTAWVATAMPTPAHGLDNIPDNQLLPKYAIDGMTTTRYTTGMTMATGDYFQVDLGAAKMVSGIVVTVTQNTTDNTYDVADGYTVGLSTDGTNFTMVKSCATSASPTETVNFAATMARYVRYTNMGPPVAPPNSATAWLSIHEFDITCN